MAAREEGVDRLARKERKATSIGLQEDEFIESDANFGFHGF